MAQSWERVEGRNDLNDGASDPEKARARARNTNGISERGEHKERKRLVAEQTTTFCSVVHQLDNQNDVVFSCIEFIYFLGTI